MSARAEILARLRAGSASHSARPGAYAPPALRSDVARFAELVLRVGGVAHGPVAAGEAPARVAALATEHAAGGRIVAAKGAHDLLGPGSWELAQPAAAPASFENVAVAIASGRVGVAENGAIAVLESDAPQRALLFLCQHLILLLPAARSVPDRHAAFAALASELGATPRMTWISGPSKTADIEQALVYGAHGPLTLDVVLIGDVPSEA